MVTIRVPFKKPVANVSTPDGSIVASEIMAPGLAEEERQRSAMALETLDAIATEIRFLRDEQRNQFEESKKQLALTAIEICRQVLKEDSELLRERVEYFAEVAMHGNATSGDAPVTVFVHPDCLSMIENWMQKKERSDLQCKADPTLTPGDCRVESDGKGIAASLDAFLEAAVMKLEGVQS